MRFGRLTRAPRRVLMLFLVVTIIPAAVLGWLSWRLFELDRELESGRARDRLDRAAELVVTALNRHISDTLDQLGKPVDRVPDGALFVTFSPDRIQAHPTERLLYYPAPPTLTTDPPDAVFESAETLEYQPYDYSGAIAALRPLATSKDPSVRAGAWIRLARNYKKLRQPLEALRAYGQLEALGPIVVRGTPADLLAREARCALFAELGRTAELRREAQSLNTDLRSGRWPLDRANYDLHNQQALSFLAPGSPLPEPSADKVALAEGVDWLWTQWQQMPHDRPSANGWRSIWVNDRPMLVIWRAADNNLTALVAEPNYLETQWGNAWKDQGVTIGLMDGDGHEALGHVAANGTLSAVRSLADTRLPWTIRVASANPGADSAPIAGRRRLLLSGLGMMALLTLLGGYFTARAAAREFAVARLQSDFVSAVSHEFRTPLTSLRHLTELLSNNVVATEDRRRQYYAVMAGETERLHSLVEGLLDFGRMEARGREHAFEEIDPVELTEAAVADFQAGLAQTGHRVELKTNGVTPKSSSVRANREALTRAIRNLLENAVKYSPNSHLVKVSLAHEKHRIAIQVHDDGFGIPAAEQKTIFDKFVRGAASKALNVPGTGIGLAMTQHIVQAHGGEMLLESKPGVGTTFTIQLPLCRGGL